MITYNKTAYNASLASYRKLGFTKEALEDPQWRLRIEAYRELGWTVEAFKDPDWHIRLEAYENLEWTEDAFKDRHWRVRLEAYEKLGFTKESLEDPHWHVRLAGYRKLGFTKESLEDPHWLVRSYATKEVMDKDKKMTCKHIATIDLNDVGGIDLIEIFNDEIIDAHQVDKQETINWLLEAYADELRRALNISLRKILNNI